MHKRIQRLSYLIIIIITSTIIFSSCSSEDEDSIVGTWKLESVNNEIKNSEVTFFTFSKDGNLTVYSNGEEETDGYSAKNKQLKITFDNEFRTFSYEIKNGQLNITDESGDVYIFSRSSSSALNEAKKATYAPTNIIGKKITLTDFDVIYNFSSAGQCSVTPGTYTPGILLTSKSPTYTYSCTNSKTASFSYNYQQSQKIGTSVMYFNWYMILTLNFTSNTGGTYTGTMRLNSGSTFTIKGTFTIY